MTYRLEPHDTIYSAVMTRAADDDTVAACRGVPGVACSRWVLGGVHTGYPAEARLRAYLMNLEYNSVDTAV